MVRTVFTKEHVMKMLEVIPDPEIPVLSIAEMGMLQDVIVSEAGYEVVITPTYSGCPAMGIIEQDIKAALAAKQVFPVTVKLVYDPAWTTDSMNEAAKEKLRQYGIAPPLHSSCSRYVFAQNIIPCPRCRSENTVLLSRFGSTACKSMYQCNDCKEPFEYFKCH
jgi:ring-1,2-phenylacetyl-CoA epoxidase subunit PaaD